MSNTKSKNYLLLLLIVLSFFLLSCNNKNQETSITSKINQEETYKGEKQDKLVVIEEGGVEGKVMGGLPQLDKSNEYILFLFQDHGNTYICGAFQGRFIIREGYVFQQATEDVKLNNYSPTTVEKFIKLIK